MNRRDFIKAMSITPAVVAASTALANIAEAEKPISDLIVVKGHDEIRNHYCFEHIYSFELKHEKQVYDNFYIINDGKNCNRKTTVINATVKLTENVNGFLPLIDDIYRFSFDIDQLRGRLFTLKSIEVSQQHQMFMTADLIGYQIYEDGLPDTRLFE